ncbi:hypothetical protein ACOME3_004252 [Neoechinorhynchus agilis]
MSSMNRLKVVRTVINHQLRNKQLGHINDSLVEKHRIKDPETSSPLPRHRPSGMNYDMFRITHPDFIPDPTAYFRDHVAEHLERLDMLNRRSQLEIPIFYVGSHLAVTSSIPPRFGGVSSEKDNRFVGICIFRGGHGLRHFFILRNVVDGTGIELIYDLYNPCIKHRHEFIEVETENKFVSFKRIQVLKLERRLDPHLLYLRDAPQEYSIVPFDLTPIKPTEDAKTGQVIAPLNDIKVPLLERAKWTQTWFYHDLRGVVFPTSLKSSELEAARRSKKPNIKYDVMRQYRKQVHDEDVQQIADEFHDNAQRREEGIGKHKGMDDGRVAKDRIIRRRQLPTNK